MPNQQETNSNTPDDIEVSDMNHLTALLNAWHADKVATLIHLRDVPEGTEVQVGEEADDLRLTLTGDSYHAFRLGIELSLNELGLLPYTTEVEDSQSQTIH